MKRIIYITIVLWLFAWGGLCCKFQKYNYENIENLCIAMPTDWKNITGMDSIQLVVGGKYRYDKSKHNYVKVEDSLYANFCYPNTVVPPFLKKDTIFNHDTIYINKIIYKNYRSVKSINQSGGITTSGDIINK